MVPRIPPTTASATPVAIACKTAAPRHQSLLVHLKPPLVEPNATSNTCRPVFDEALTDGTAYALL